MSAPQFSPASLRPVLEGLRAAGFERNVIVGGQAVNLWALRYRRPGDPAWEALLPFTSEDLDVLGSPADARRWGAAVSASTVKVADVGTAGPNTGLLLVPLGNDGGEARASTRLLRVDVLAWIVGVGTMQALESAVDYRGEGEMAGLNLKVLHPLLCLEGKLACLAQLSQAGRQDAKHAALSILSARGYLEEVLATRGARPLLKAVERLWRLAATAEGLAGFGRAGLRPESATPFDAIRRSAVGGEAALATFLAVRLPQLESWLEQARAEDAAARPHSRLG